MGRGNLDGVGGSGHGHDGNPGTEHQSSNDNLQDDNISISKAKHPSGMTHLSDSFRRGGEDHAEDDDDRTAKHAPSPAESVGKDGGEWSTDPRAA